MHEHVPKAGHLRQPLRQIARHNFMRREHCEDFSMIFRYSGLDVRKNVIADIENTLNGHLNVVFCYVDGVGIMQELRLGMGPRDLLDS